MDENLRDVLGAGAVAAAVIVYQYFRYKTRRHRLELIHQERLVAIEKGVPLPELPIDPIPAPDPHSQDVPLILGLILTALSVGTMIVLFVNLSPAKENFWVAPLPIALVGVGLMLYHFLGRERAR